MAGFVFQLIIMIKQEWALACSQLVAKFYNKKVFKLCKPYEIL